MSEITLKPISVNDLLNAPTMAALLREYGEEVRQEGLPFPMPAESVYLALEASGSLFIQAAYTADTLIGFMVCNLVALPQYGSSRVCAEMSFFVTHSQRKTGAGKMLLDTCKAHAKTQGAAGFVITAKAGSVFARIVERWGFTESNRIYFQAL